jgi:hypothetical protein
MGPTSTRVRPGLRCERFVGLAAVALAVAVCAGGLTGCGVVSAVNKAAHDVRGNKATIDTFTGRIQAGEATAFEATYQTTGGSPATVIYAVDPPKGVAFTDTPAEGSAGGTSVNIVANASGEYACTPSSASDTTASPAWTCQELPALDASDENNLFDFYTPTHWVNFLKGFSLAAGIAGDAVTTSTMTVNGFALQCVDFRAPGVAGLSTICTTAQGILGYVKVASDATNFEITKYSPSPPPSLFELPANASVVPYQGSTS